MKPTTAILIVSFGTTHMETCSKTLYAIEKDIRRKYTSYLVCHAWTNAFIRNRFEKQHGTHILSVTEALTQIQKSGIRQVIVQPTYVIHGLEYHSMTDEVHKFDSYFTDIKIGAPLLSSKTDIQKVADVIGHSQVYVPNEYVIYMGHGTEHDSNTIYSAVNQQLAKCGYSNIIIGTMSAHPTIYDIIDALKKRNIKKVTLVPFMIVAGSHAVNNLAGNRPDSWKRLLENAGFEVACVLKGLGECPQIRQIFIEHLEENMN